LSTGAIRRETLELRATRQADFGHDDFKFQPLWQPYCSFGEELATDVPTITNLRQDPRHLPFAANLSATWVIGLE
jgi:hypothetical protein